MPLATSLTSAPADVKAVKVTRSAYVELSAECVILAVNVGVLVPDTDVAIIKAPPPLAVELVLSLAVPLPVAVTVAFSRTLPLKKPLPLKRFHFH